MARQPTRKRVASAGDPGQVLKVLFLDEGGEPVGEWASQQLPEDSFAGHHVTGVQNPPYSLEQLVYLAETHPVHSAALEQKTSDVIGKGWQWQGREGNEGSDDEREALSDWFDELAPDDQDVREVLYSAWLDVETTGWGLTEVSRDPSGVVRKLYPVPSHTVRAHKDGFRLVQIRQEKKVWFRRWGAPLGSDGEPVEVDAKTGSTRAVRQPANELLVIKRPSRRSTWYGIPGYVSAIGWITLSLAARDDNLYMFSNKREPRWAIILSNLADTDGTLQPELERAFKVDMQQPHRNLMIPISGNGKIDFQRLSVDRMDGNFDKLSDRADRAIMVAHRVPGERLANSQVGPLGGNATFEASRIYKEGVVAPGQEVLQARLNRFIDVEYDRARRGEDNPEPVPFLLVMDDLDVASDREELNQASIAFHNDLITLREARARVKLGPLPGADGEESPYNDLLYTEIPGTSATSTLAPTGSGAVTQAREENEELQTQTRALLLAAQATHESLAALSEQVRDDLTATPD